MSRPDAVKGLDRVLWEWVEGGSEEPIAAWLGRELDESGGPRRLSIAEWVVCAHLAANARKQRRDWSAQTDDAVIDLINAAARFDLRDNRILTQPLSGESSRIEGLTMLPSRPARLGVPRRGVCEGWASSGRVMACLGEPTKAALAVEHGGADALPRKIELALAGRSWLGPRWTVAKATDAQARGKPRTGLTEAAAGFHEWRSRDPHATVTCTIALFQSLGLAVIAAFVEASDQHPELSMRLAISEGVSATSIPGVRGLQLNASTAKPTSVQLFPVGLPSRDHATERGRMTVDGNEIVLAQASPGKKGWLPMVVSWNARRRGKPVTWRSLTITEKGKHVSPERASAARITWGRDETYLLYRSHARPALRAFLGHCTTTRFLFAKFDKDGTVTPIFKLDD